MFIPLLLGLIPVLVGVAEKLIPVSESGSEKKKMVNDVLRAIYERVLKGHMPDFPGVDEEKLFIELCDFLIDLAVKHTLNKGNG